ADIAGATDHGLAHTGDVCVLTWAAVADIGQGHVVALVQRALDTDLVAVLALAAAAGGGIARYARVEAHRRGNGPAGEDAKPLWRPRSCVSHCQSSPQSVATIVRCLLGARCRFESRGWPRG